jgi:hypothetical protein
MQEKIISDHILIFYFSILTFFFNLYLLYLPCIPRVPDKLILIITLFVTQSLLILIPLKIIKYKNKEIPFLIKDILDISHWGYLLIIPVGIFLAKSMPAIVLMISISWFALIARAIYSECPLTKIAEKTTMIPTSDGIVNLYFCICSAVGCIRLFIN